MENWKYFEMLHFPILGNIRMIWKTAEFIMLLEHLDRLYYSGRGSSDR